MNKSILSAIAILLSITSFAKSKSFFLPEWALCPNSSEYIGFSQPCDIPDVAINSALLSYIICGGKIGYDNYFSSYNSSEKVTETSTGILGEYKGQIYFNLCRQERLPDGEWVVSISDGQQQVVNVELVYQVNWDQNNTASILDTKIIFKTDNSEWVLSMNVKDSENNGNYLLNQSFTNTSGNKIIFSSDTILNFIPKIHSEDYWGEIIFRATDEGLFKNSQLSFGCLNKQSPISDVYNAGLIHLISPEFPSGMGIFETAADCLKDKDISSEYKSFMSCLPKMDMSESYKTTESQVLRREQVGYRINLPRHIDAIFFRDGVCAFSLPVADCGQKQDAIIYSSRMLYKSMIKENVEEQVRKWAKKDEFETSSQWRNRVTKIRRDSLARTIVAELTSKLIEDAQLKYWTKLSLGPYDADNQSFAMTDEIWGDFYLTVPLKDAKLFKEGWDTSKKDFTFGIDNGKYFLEQIKITDKSGQVFLCDNSSEVNYENAVRELNLGEIDYGGDGTYRTHIKKRQRSNTVRQSDIDLDIPQGTGDNKKSFAVIIANQQYQYEQDVLFAQNDGATFKEYLVKTLGLPEENVHIVNDATLNNISREVNWISKVSQAYNGEASIIFYYAGHGIPDEKTKDAYLLPVDGYGTDPLTGFSLNRLYSNLGKNPTKQTLVLLDACFSGAVRGEGMLENARGVAINVKEQKVEGNMIVISATQGDQTAWPYPEKSHGMFTYYLLKKIRETGGKLTIGELSDYVTEQVTRQSIVHNSKSQTPSVATSLDSWRELSITP